MLMKKMSLHVDLRLTVAVFGAALCPPWTALGVLQVGLVGSVIRYSGESHWTNYKWSSPIHILINENLIICSLYVYSLFMHIWQNMLNWLCFQTIIDIPTYMGLLDSFLLPFLGSRVFAEWMNLWMTTRIVVALSENILYLHPGDHPQ